MSARALGVVLAPCIFRSPAETSHLAFESDAAVDDFQGNGPAFLADCRRAAECLAGLIATGVEMNDEWLNGRMSPEFAVSAPPDSFGGEVPAPFQMSDDQDETSSRLSSG
ncbi:hypothetical protein HK405_000273, partial [Cladochytrium tenue]